ncbi:MAG: NAD(P)H-dependent glycerol-3-phosphate dehydrogenase [Pseudomonadota bacterium]|nr:NAD(P)H-dependent glycerol-3-phosphate dehydrogenase [Pseudomonadota bacterium]MEC9392372.1 NAD(P)H-dependent glycerol-3-phosphate dehydrogenase [Pseudomonadota bacterium]MEC9459541.1 NAD(P)H-dependent glycerol-3-phosphate dehydrogenase [Pseudomonadota bacterium]
MEQIKKYTNISIIGAGAWGTALAEVISRQGNQINLWAREDDVVKSINTLNENTLYLPNVKLSELIVAQNNLDNVINCDLLLMVTPSQFMRSVLEEIKDNLNDSIPVVLCSKGIETKTLSLMNEITESIIPKNPLAILSGPSFAIDVVNNKPTAVTLACKDLSIGKNIADSISLPTFRPYLSEDVVGAQIGGATKNVIAIAAGVVEGQNLGDSARAATIARGFSEINRLAVALGGQEETLSGLSGMGDLLLTCNSITSRNFSLGIKLGKGLSAEEATDGLSSIAEGMYSAKAIDKLSKKLGVEMPITNAVNDLIERKRSLDEIIDDLLSRPIRREK